MNPEAHSSDPVARPGASGADPHVSFGDSALFLAERLKAVVMTEAAIIMIVIGFYWWICSWRAVNYWGRIAMWPGEIFRAEVVHKLFQYKLVLSGQDVIDRQQNVWLSRRGESLRRSFCGSGTSRTTAGCQGISSFLPILFQFRRMKDRHYKIVAQKEVMTR
jgi:hypothetical protein